MEGKCYCCSKEGHRSPQCQDKDKPKAEWAINKANRAMHKQARQNQKLPHLLQQVIITKNSLKVRVKDGQGCTINYTNKKT